MCMQTSGVMAPSKIVLSALKTIASKLADLTTKLDEEGYEWE
jgi:hypothetical protein